MGRSIPGRVCAFRNGPGHSIFAVSGARENTPNPWDTGNPYCLTGFATSHFFTGMARDKMSLKISLKMSLKMSLKTGRARRAPPDSPLGKPPSAVRNASAHSGMQILYRNAKDPLPNAISYLEKTSPFRSATVRSFDELYDE
jgi:hypothetical protein